LRSLALLLSLTCLGSGAALVLGRQLLQQRAWPDPLAPAAALEAQRRFEPDPVRRREAALLLVAAEEQRQEASRGSGAGRTDAKPAGDGQAGDPQRIAKLLRNQGWGRDPLAAVVLKRAAQSADRTGDQAGSSRLWQQLLARFPSHPASADALYRLGRDQPALRQRLLRSFPAHPAALAAALESGPAGAVHLARWGARWPGADPVIASACDPERKNPSSLSGQDRDLLARSLVSLGNLEAAERCLDGQAGSPATQLERGRLLLRSPENRDEGEALLLALAQQHPASPAAGQAAELLAESTSSSSLERLGELPAPLQESAAVEARRALVVGQTSSAVAVLQRWPRDPASWELQWRLARERLLQEDWRAAAVLLGTSALDTAALPAPVDARRRFWLALSQWQQGQRPEARAGWAALLARHPGGYYGWRASLRLGRGDIDLDPATAPPLLTPPWRPLGSGLEDLDQLWRLGQSLEAWEQWRDARAEQSLEGPERLLLEGRLRRGVGDHWTGLSQLEQANLQLRADQCPTVKQVAESLAESAFSAELNQAGRQTGVAPTLLAAVARQESRFSTAVRSPAGAVGLLQLLPETADELTSGPLAPEALEDPQRNADLGALYLSQLMARWEENPLLVTASYNAGPNAVADWLGPWLDTLPELWVEAIPFPETRIYVKKVLGNLWDVQSQKLPVCP
jgi:soluble lytic murein transglycosylase